MLTRCRKGLIIVSSKSFLRGGGRNTLLGKLEQEWVKRVKDAAWVDWRLVADSGRKCRLPHGRDTVTTGRTEVYPGPTPMATPTFYKLHVPIQPPVKDSCIEERQRSPYIYTTTSETSRPSLSVPEQPSKQGVVNHDALPVSPRLSVPIQLPLEDSCIKERQRSPYNHTTTSSKETVVNHSTPPVSQPSAPIQPPPDISCIKERQRSPYNHTTSSKQTVVNHGAPPPSPPQARDRKSVV